MTKKEFLNSEPVMNPTTNETMSEVSSPTIYQTQNIFHGQVGSFQIGNLNSASVSRENSAEPLDDHSDEADEDNGLLIDQTVKVRPNEHVRYTLTLAKDFGIRYQVDSNDPLDVLILDSRDYKRWRNRGELDGHYKLHAAKCVTDSEFRPPHAGEYLMVISNVGFKKAKADITVTHLDEGH